jgi:predicted type IV restriction endonuclease
MDLIDKLREIASQIPRQREHIQTEEATKNALVMPFIQALGYNIFDPTEVVPEFTADVGIKKGEKIDYAIMQTAKPIILMEAKTLGSSLRIEHASQLFRYFATVEARFGILTDGVIYHFYTDLDKPNKMDEKPFLIFDMLNIDEKLVNELKKFSKAAFNVDAILSSASELKYTREIKHLLDTEFNAPSDDFVRLFTKQVYTGPLRQNVIDEFREITKQAFRNFIKEKVTTTFQSALNSEREDTQETEVIEETVPVVTDGGNLVETTQDELDGFYIVRAILREIIPVQRIVLRDVRSYCGVLLDDNNRKPICRLHFNRAQKHFGIFGVDKNEERIVIENLDEIYKYAERLKAIVQHYDNGG